MTKSVAITGAAKAKQTKADVPSKPTLRGFELIVLAWGIGRMASVLETELLTLTPTTKYPLESCSNNGSQRLKNGNLCFYESIRHSEYQ